MSTSAAAVAKSVLCPFNVVIDSREQLPFAFAGLRTDAREGNKPLLVQTVRRGLSSGDYSIEGFEERVAVERKSAADLFSTLSTGRDRFTRELARLSRYDCAAVVVESSYRSLLLDPPARSQLSPRSVIRSIIAWQQRYPTVHWWDAPDRAFAEMVTFRILERFWIDTAAKADFMKS